MSVFEVADVYNLHSFRLLDLDVAFECQIFRYDDWNAFHRDNRSEWGERKFTMNEFMTNVKKGNHWKFKSMQPIKIMRMEINTNETILSLILDDGIFLRVEFLN